MVGLVGVEMTGIVVFVKSDEDVKPPCEITWDTTGRISILTGDEFMFVAVGMEVIVGGI